MKLKTSIILCSIIAATTMPAVADSAIDLYAGVSVGVGAQTLFGDGRNETNTSQSFGAMFGLDIPVFRTELEYTYIGESDSHANIGFANAYFKMPSTAIRPYLGLGIGVLTNHPDRKDVIHLVSKRKKNLILSCVVCQNHLSLKAEFRNKIHSDYQQLYHSAFIIQHSAF